MATAACGGVTEPGSNGSAASLPANSEKPAASTAAADKKEPVKIVWWHSMGGELGKAIDKVVTDYNASQTGIKVEVV